MWLQQIGRFVAAGLGDGRGHPVTIDEELQAQAVGIPDHHAVAGGMVYFSLDRNSGTGQSGDLALQIRLVPDFEADVMQPGVKLR